MKNIHLMGRMPIFNNLRANALINVVISGKMVLSGQEGH